jgi:hypothetical protein
MPPLRQGLDAEKCNSGCKREEAVAAQKAYQAALKEVLERMRRAATLEEKVKLAGKE